MSPHAICISLGFKSAARLFQAYLSFLTMLLSCLTILWLFRLSSPSFEHHSFLSTNSQQPSKKLGTFSIFSARDYWTLLRSHLLNSVTNKWQQLLLNSTRFEDWATAWIALTIRAKFVLLMRSFTWPILWPAWYLPWIAFLSSRFLSGYWIFVKISYKFFKSSWI